MPLFEENFSKESFIEYPALLREDQLVDKGGGHSSDRKIDYFKTPSERHFSTFGVTW